MNNDTLTIKNFRVRAVNVPMKRPLETASNTAGPSSLR